MKNDIAELVFILDRSGSMGGLEKDTIGGFNAMMEKQRAVEGECRVTTVLFDNRSMLLHDRVDIRAVAPMTEKEYIVGGSTALLDAIGQTIGKIAAVQKSTAEAYRADKVLFVIITDGEENASREYTAQRVKQMIEREKSEFGWEFIFLGANIDAVRTAGSFGIAPNRAVDYVSDVKGTRVNYCTVSHVVEEFRTTAHISDDSLDAIREDRKKRGGKS